MADMGFSTRAFTVATAMRTHRGRASLADKLRAIPAMVRDVLSGRWAGVGRLRIVASLIALLYVLSPLDLIPEALLGPFGLGDDLAIATLAIASLFGAAEQWLDRTPTSEFDNGDVVEGVVLDRSQAPG